MQVFFNSVDFSARALTQAAADLAGPKQYARVSVGLAGPVAGRSRRREKIVTGE